MYYTELNPENMKPVYVCKNPHEKAMQRALIQYRNPQNYALVREALIKAHREDLIGFDKKCLIRPQRGETFPGGKGKNTKKAEGKSVQGKKKTIRNVHKKKGK